VDWGRAITVVATGRKKRIENENWEALAVLVRRAQDGDREAFGRLVEQFQRTVHAIGLRRLGNPSEALELTQEVFLHVMRRIGQLREPERFAGWLRQVTVRMAINRATRRTAPPSVETAVLEGAGERHDNPLDQMITRERAQHLWEALDRLKHLDRETLVGFYIHGQSLVEMAERLDAPLGTIKRRLHTARKRLKAELVASVADANEWNNGIPVDPDADTDTVDEGQTGGWDEPQALLVGAGSAAW
jgi:RNA polymerase sigma-70 factor (ECF subfamily)